MIKKTLKKIVPEKLKSSVRSILINGLGEHVVFNDMFRHLEVLKQLGYKPNYVFDVGAYKGKWTRRTQSIFPEAHFIIIEAQSDKELFLKEVCDSYSNVEYHITLLGGELGVEVPFFKMETGSSIYSEQTDVKREVIPLTMRTLDSLLPELKSEDKIFLKLDVQGAELDVLKGAEKTLTNVDLILLEASVLNYNKDAPLIGDLFVKMKELNFILFDICEQKRTLCNVLMQVDLLFIKNDSELRDRCNFK